MYPMIDFMA